MGWTLEMKSPHNAIFRARLVILHKIHRTHKTVKDFLVIALKKIAPSVSKHPGFEDDNTLYICLYHIHSSIKFLEFIFIGNLHKILPILVLQHRLSQFAELVNRYPTVAVGYTLQACDLQTLTLLKHLHID